MARQRTRRIQTNKRWSEEEDQTVLRYVKANPQNLHKCFMMVSEYLTDAGNPRTATAVQAHWYSVLSKKPGVLAFGTITPRYFSRNRKNGEGVSISANIWRRFCNLIRNLL